MGYSNLDAKTIRAIDIKEGDKIDESALKNLIRIALPTMRLVVKRNEFDFQRL